MGSCVNSSDILIWLTEYVEGAPVPILVLVRPDHVVALHVLPELGAVEEHPVTYGAEVCALAGDPGLEAHLALLQVDGDGGGHRGRGGRHLDCRNGNG